MTVNKQYELDKIIFKIIKNMIYICTLPTVILCNYH
jgi:hypothetical protein